jgi:hypothetical protein
LLWKRLRTCDIERVIDQTLRSLHKGLRRRQRSIDVERSLIDPARMHPKQARIT